MQLRQPFFFASFALALMACPASSQTSAAHQRTATSPAKQSSAQPKLTDQQLETIIREKFAKSKSSNQFRVRVQGGVATIEGKTDVVQHKGAATRMARTAGATVVNNKVEVSETGKKNASGNLEEGRRRVQVKRGDSRSDR